MWETQQKYCIYDLVSQIKFKVHKIGVWGQEIANNWSWIKQ